MSKRFLIKHVGNMGDMIFFVPPILATLKRVYPDCSITFVTAWGFKDARGRWGKRNQDGFCIALMMNDPHIDQLVHWHDTKTSLAGDICIEEGRQFPTWNKAFFEQEKKSGAYDGVYELDFGIHPEDNPIKRMYEIIGLPTEIDGDYKLYVTQQDSAVAAEVMAAFPKPRIVLLEGLEGATTRGWDTGKIKPLERAIQKMYGVAPIWFGGRYAPEYHGRPLTLRENIALLTLCDAGIGVLSGPLHFAVGVGLPTLTLFCDQPLHRDAPAYFVRNKGHRTLLGPAMGKYTILKSPEPPPCLTPHELKQQHYRGWQSPGKQATKSGQAVITVEEIMTVLHDMLNPV